MSNISDMWFESYLLVMYTRWSMHIVTCDTTAPVTDKTGPYAQQIKQSFMQFA